ncbi:MAG: hypothetical protein OEZ68_01475 [Gammaproteobacteria bacterium]|nr:hypothetical protein [Gammaproteobacteria bacterium]MDH5799449.1 hypothetical protein [Gammaproteobacteria bacterium]
MKSTSFRTGNKLGRQQKGVVLLTSLSFLVIITIIAVAAMRSSNNELRIAGIHEENMSARQLAQAGIDSIVENYTTAFNVTGNAGTITNNVSPSGLTEFTNTTVLTLTEQGIKSPPRGLGVSKDKFATALFDIKSDYDGTAGRKGREVLHQGMLLLIPRI